MGLEKELKPCPFCGSKAERKTNRKDRAGFIASVGCVNQLCPAQIQQATLVGTAEDAYQYAEDAWNTRHTIDESNQGEAEVYLNDSKLDEIVKEYVTPPSSEEERKVKMMVLSLVSDLRNSRADNEHLQGEADRYRKALEEIAEYGGTDMIGKTCADVARKALSHTEDGGQADE